MCAVIRGANGEADTIGAACVMGYLNELLLVRDPDSIGTLEMNACMCLLDIEESLDACGVVWTGGYGTYEVHEQTELFG